MDDKKERLDFIPSKTVREYARENGFVFSHRDIATILYHSLPCYKRREALKTLADHTDDARLQAEIRERLDYEAMLLARFKASDSSFFYIATEEDDGNESRLGHFAYADSAIAAGKVRRSPFSVSKYQLADLREHLITHGLRVDPRRHPDGLPQWATENPYFGDPIAGCSYDEHGDLQSYWSEEASQEERDRVEDWGAERFEERFLVLPNPFERGDLVCTVNDPHEVGVVATSREEWRAALKRAVTRPEMVDFSDASVTVEFLMKNGGFSHCHLSPLILERAELKEDDIKSPSLDAASRILRGTGMLSELFWHRGEYLDAVERERWADSTEEDEEPW